MRTDDTPPLKLVAVGGLDDAGDGSAGSGGVDDPIFTKDSSPFSNDKNILPTPEAIKDAKENIQKYVVNDPTANLAISPAQRRGSSVNWTKLCGRSCSTAARRRVAASRQARETTTPLALGRAAAATTPRRSARCAGLLRFRVASGRDYLDQLRAMNAQILVPLPPNDNGLFVLPRLEQHRGCSGRRPDADFKDLAGKIKFSDTRRDAVQGVAGALGLDVRPKTFWAFFPKDLEVTLARLETGFPRPARGGHRRNDLQGRDPRRQIRAGSGRTGRQALRLGCRLLGMGRYF